MGLDVGEAHRGDGPGGGASMGGIVHSDRMLPERERLRQGAPGLPQGNRIMINISFGQPAIPTPQEGGFQARPYGRPMFQSRSRQNAIALRSPGCTARLNRRGRRGRREKWALVNGASGCSPEVRGRTRAGGRVSSPPVRQVQGEGRSIMIGYRPRTPIRGRLPCRGTGQALRRYD